MSSPILRRRIEGVARLDSIALQALLTRAQGRRASGGRRPVLAAIAALLGLAAMAVWWNRGGASGLAAEAPVIASSGHGPPERAAAGSGEREYSAVRVVFSVGLGSGGEPADAMTSSDLPVNLAGSGSDSTGGAAVAGDALVAQASPARAAEAGDTEPRSPAASVAAAIPTASQTIEAFEKLLAKGDVPAGAELIASADAGTRRELYRRLGSVLLSADTAAKVLDRLPGDVAIEVCSAWLESGGQRPLAIKHLSRRAQDAALRDHVHVAIRDLLEEKPELRAWMVSYANWAVTTAPPSKAKDGAGMDGSGASNRIAGLGTGIQGRPSAPQRGPGNA